MKIAIIGLGQMGNIIKDIAQGRGHDVTTIDRSNSDADFKAITNVSIGDADVCIDFTHPDSAVKNITQIASLGKNMVIGTTGWYDDIPKVKETVISSGVGMIYASNFSIGMNIMFSLVEKSSKIFDKFSSYDVAGIEYHHNMKADSPSGTAKSIASIIAKNIERKKIVVYDIIDRNIEPDELHFASVRCGSIPGTHKVIFDSKADTIELTHTARNRHGFALGAVLAAEWIIGKTGLFKINDMMKEMVD